MEILSRYYYFITLQGFVFIVLAGECYCHYNGGVPRRY